MHHSPLRSAATTARVAAIATALALAGCAAISERAPETPAPDEVSPGHGAIAGATEAPEPPLKLVVVDASGEAAMLDLLDGTETTLGPVRAPEQLTTDGRYAFVADARGVDIIDSGAWTWDHVDHFHYYEAPTAAPGSVSGVGIASIATGMLATTGGTGLFFPESGEAVLLDNAALAEGQITETLRLKGAPHHGLIAPLGDGALLTEAAVGDPAGGAVALRAVDHTGTELGRIDCPAAAGSSTTRVALAVGCADGAVLATATGTTVRLEKVSYPAGAAAPATAFAGRKGRPTVAGLGADSGVWLLNTRAHSWSWVPLSERPLQAVALDDEAGHIVVLLESGAVAVHDSSGIELGRTDTLVATPAEPGVSLSVDGHRAYVNDPDSGSIFEIDFADHARVARTLHSSVAAGFFAETGR